MESKDKDVPGDQILHAARNNVLIIRTLDILRIFNMVKEDKITSTEVLNIFKTKYGWLKVADDDYEIVETV